MRNPEFVAFAESAGIVFMGVHADFQKPGVSRSLRIAQDAQPALVTTSSAGIPAYLTTYHDPKLINILVAPMKAAEIAGSEVKKGDWTTDTAMFTIIEATGEVSSYGDFSELGIAGINANFPQRQAYHYQVITEWGEREMARAGLAAIDLANQKNMASILTLNKFQNKSYFYGITGLQNYGLLNSPNLPAAIAPSSGAAWSTKDGLAVYQDIASLVAQLISQSDSLVDMSTPMTLAMSPLLSVNLTKSTAFNVNVTDLLTKNFPNLKIVTAPEYSTTSGELMQLFVDEYEGQRTVEVAFTEKLRAHPVVVAVSSFKQKKSQGTFGALLYRPMFVAQMLGM